MSSPNNNATSIRNHLTQIYDQLSSIEKQIVQLYSVIYGPISRSEFLSCVNSCDLKDENNKLFNAKNLKKYIDKLINLEVLIQERGKGPQCNPLLVEIATRESVKEKAFQLFAKISERQLSRNSSYSSYYYWGDWSFLRKIRIAIYSHDFNSVLQEFDDYYQQRRYYGQGSLLSWEDVILKIFNNPFDADWLCTFPLTFLETVISSLLSVSFHQMMNMDSVFNLLYEQCFHQGKFSSDYLRLVLCEQLLLRGKFSDTEENLQQISEEYSPNADVFRGWLCFLKGENEKAIA